MQNLFPELVLEAKKEKMKNLDENLKEFIRGSQIGERVVCPECNYISKKNRKGTAVIYKDSIKCFACGLWRRI